MKKIVFLFISTLATSLMGQLVPSAGQFYAVHSYYNPAVAGAGESLRAGLLYKRQWTAFDVAPQSTFFTVDSRLGRGMGGGLAVAYDQVFKYRQMDVMANFSYRLDIGSESFLQGGIRAGVSMINFGTDNLSNWDENDPLISSQSGKATLPRIGAGLFYKHPKFWLGLSAPDLLSIDSKKVFEDDSTGNKTLHSNYVLTGGAKFSINEYINLVPSVMVRYYPTRPVYYMLNAGLEFNQTVTAGLSYASPSTIGLFGMVGLSPKLKFGYRYELIRGGFQLGNFSSNELMLSYGF